MFSKKQTNDTSWQSVYVDEIGTNSYKNNSTFTYYVKYGNISIARNKNIIYVEKGSKTVKKKTKPAITSFGGVLTNGKDILYQRGGDVILWKNITTEKKIFKLGRKGDILVGKYGNTIYFGREIDYDEYHVYSYNLKTGKQTNEELFNGYYCNGKYLVYKGQFHEGIKAPVVLYNMQTGKSITIARNGSFGNATIISGRKVYYIELNEKKWTSRVIRYDLRTKKKEVLKKGLLVRPEWLDKNHYCFTDDDGEDVYVYDIRNGNETVY